MKRTLTILTLAILLAGCSKTVQTTSGSEYLSQYKYVPVSPSIRMPSSVDPSRTEEIKSIDQRIRDVAAVEPILKFPARIGLARIEGGTLTVIPVEEIEGWNKTREKLGDTFGEFIPVSPMIANMVAGNNRYSRYDERVNGIIDIIRLGAARQHLDAVLIYEVMSKESSRSNILSVANASIIGGYILPSKQYDAEGLGNAILIDVVQGYPYGTLNTVVEKKSRVSSSWGWGSDNGNKEVFADKIKAQVAKQLSEEAYDMFIKLRTELAERNNKEQRQYP